MGRRMSGTGGRFLGDGPRSAVLAGALVLAACGGGGAHDARLAAGDRPGQAATATTAGSAEVGEDGRVRLACAPGSAEEIVIVDYTADAPTFATPEAALEAGREEQNDSLRSRTAEAAAHGLKRPNPQRRPGPLRYERLASGERGVVFVGRDETGAPIATITVVRFRDRGWIAEAFEMCSDRIADGGEY
jgi:hypothetical protein